MHTCIVCTLFLFATHLSPLLLSLYFMHLARGFVLVSPLKLCGTVETFAV